VSPRVGDRRTHFILQKFSSGGSRFAWRRGGGRQAARVEKSKRRRKSRKQTFGAPSNCGDWEKGAIAVGGKRWFSCPPATGPGTARVAVIRGFVGDRPSQRPAVRDGGHRVEDGSRLPTRFAPAPPSSGKRKARFRTGLTAGVGSPSGKYEHP